MRAQAYRSWLTAAAPARVSPDTTASIVAKATADINPKKIFPPTAFARCIAAILFPPLNPPSAFKNSGFVEINIIAPKPIMKVSM